MLAKTSLHVFWEMVVSETTGFDQNKRIQNPDPTITDELCNKSKSEVDPDSNSTPKVDLKKNTGRPIFLLEPGII